MKSILSSCRMEGDGFVQFKAMIMTTSMHLMLLVFDILACDNLETDNHSWMFVFIPLMFMSIVSIGFCVWAIKNERSFEVGSLNEPPRGKTNNVVSEQVRHKPTCTVTEKSWNLEILDLSRKGTVLSE